MKIQKILISILGLVLICTNAFSKEPAYIQVFFENSLIREIAFKEITRVLAFLV